MGKRLLVATLVAIGPLVAFAQNLITGHITDVRTGEPLIGASVIVKTDKGRGVVTDVDGNFKLETKADDIYALSGRENDICGRNCTTPVIIL